MLRLLLALVLMSCGVAHAAFNVRMTAPAAGSTYTAPATFQASAFATITDDGQWVTSIKLFRNNVQIASGSDTVTHTVTGLPAGTHTFHAVATNNLGQSVSSASVSVTVVVPGGLPPTVSLNVPTGAPFIAPATVGLSATATDSDGTVARVDFYAGGTLLGSDSSSPFQFTWSNVATGSYSITAKATDNSNVSTTSAPRTVTITTSVVKGNIDGVSLSGSQYNVTGWACSTGRNESIQVHLYAGGPANGGGAGVGSYTANLVSEAGLAASCQASGTHYRFSVPLSASTRQQHANKTIYIHGISPVGAGNLLINNSGEFTIPAPLSQTRKYTYNANQELCRSVEPETGVTGTPACPTDGLPPAAVEGRTVYRIYDRRNRLEELSFPDGNGNQSWSYWPDGLPKTVTTWNIGFEGAEPQETRNNYVYNRRRLLTTESIVMPAWYGFNVGYKYNANGHVIQTSYPSNYAVHTTVNALGQPKALTSAAGGGGTPYATGITYYPNGAVAGFTYGNNIVHTMTPNDRQLPALSRDAYGGTEFLEDSYIYDANGNVNSIDDTRTANSSDRTMLYDDLDRLTDVTSPMYGSTGAHYSYNGLDDLTRVQVGGNANRDHYYCYAAGRLTNVKTGGCSGSTVIGLDYDLQGNLANKNGQLYEFDYGNRLREVVDIERYRYDAHGRRVLAMAFATGTVLSHYGLDGRLMYQKSDRTGKQSDSIYLGSSLVAIREMPINGGTVMMKYQHTDALGSPVVVTDQNRVPVERSEYEPFGNVLNRPMHDGPGYTGHVEDAATGLVQMQQRYYDPGIGRFLSVDPVTADASTGANFNRYKYAANNPYRFIDPDGRIDWDMLGDSFKLEGSVGLTLEAKFKIGPLKAALGLGSATYGGGVTLAPDSYAFQEVAGPSATLEFGPYGAGPRGSIERSYQGRNGQLYSEESKKRSGAFQFKRGELDIEEGGSNSELSGSLGIAIAKVSGSVDLGQAWKALKSPGGDGGGSKRGFEGIRVDRVEGRIDSNRLDKELRGK
jgi:RHS repeat-associated protein